MPRLVWILIVLHSTRADFRSLVTSKLKNEMVSAISSHFHFAPCEKKFFDPIFFTLEPSLSNDYYHYTDENCNNFLTFFLINARANEMSLVLQSETLTIHIGPSLEEYSLPHVFQYKLERDSAAGLPSPAHLYWIVSLDTKNNLQEERKEIAIELKEQTVVGLEGDFKGVMEGGLEKGEKGEKKPLLKGEIGLESHEKEEGKGSTIAKQGDEPAEKLSEEDKNREFDEKNAKKLQIDSLPQKKLPSLLLPKFSAVPEEYDVNLKLLQGRYRKYSIVQGGKQLGFLYLAERGRYYHFFSVNQEDEVVLETKATYFEEDFDTKRLI